MGLFLLYTEIMIIAAITIQLWQLILGSTIALPAAGVAIVSLYKGVITMLGKARRTVDEAEHKTEIEERDKQILMYKETVQAFEARLEAFQIQLNELKESDVKGKIKIAELKQELESERLLREQAEKYSAPEGFKKLEELMNKNLASMHARDTVLFETIRKLVADEQAKNNS